MRQEGAQIAERTRNLLNIPPEARTHERWWLVVRLRRLTHFDGRNTQEATPRPPDRARAGRYLYLVSLAVHTGYFTAAAAKEGGQLGHIALHHDRAGPQSLRPLHLPRGCPGKAIVRHSARKIATCRLPVGALVMAALGDVLHRGVIAEFRQIIHKVNAWYALSSHRR